MKFEGLLNKSHFLKTLSNIVKSCTLATKCIHYCQFVVANINGLYSYCVAIDLIHTTNCRTQALHFVLQLLRKSLFSCLFVCLFVSFLEAVGQNLK